MHCWLRRMRFYEDLSSISMFKTPSHKSYNFAMITITVLRKEVTLTAGAWVYLAVSETKSTETLTGTVMSLISEFNITTVIALEWKFWSTNRNKYVQLYNNYRCWSITLHVPRVKMDVTRAADANALS